MTLFAKSWNGKVIISLLETQRENSGIQLWGLKLFFPSLACIFISKSQFTLKIYLPFLSRQIENSIYIFFMVHFVYLHHLFLFCDRYCYHYYKIFRNKMWLLCKIWKCVFIKKYSILENVELKSYCNGFENHKSWLLGVK